MFLRFKKYLNNWPIALKVTLWYTLLMGLIFAVVAGFTVKFTENMTIGMAQEELRRHVEAAARKPQKFDEHDDEVYVTMFDGKNTKVRGRMPAGMPEGLPPRLGQDIQRFNQGDREFQYYDMQVKDKGQYGSEGTWVRGAIATNKILKRSQLTLLGLLLALPIFIIIAALGGYRIIKRGFEPVRTISATACEIGETTDLSKRIPLDDGQDEIHQMAGTFNEMLDKLEASVEREKQFSSDVSHELRTPVAVIMSESEYGKDYTESVADAKESFASIFGQSKRMSVMINQLLELARMNHNKLEMEQLDLSGLVQEQLPDYRLLAEARGMQLVTDIDSNIKVSGNYNLLQRAFANYLDNALKFTKSKVVVAVKLKEGRPVFTVTDDGDGISSENLTRIWDRLYQIEESRNRNSNSGLGLGLALVATIARLHHARAYADSEVNKGSTFGFEFAVGKNI